MSEHYYDLQSYALCMRLTVKNHEQSLALAFEKLMLYILIVF